MSVTKNEAITVSETMFVPFAPETVWPLLCPVREFDWIESWDCNVIQTKSGVNELGCVFSTDFPTECGPEVWMTCRFDPNERLEFVRTNMARTIHFTITLAEKGEGTELVWSQHVVPLNEQGKVYVASKPQAFRMQMTMVEKFLTHYLQTGEMVRNESIGLTEEIQHHVHGRKAG